MEKDKILEAYERSILKEGKYTLEMKVYIDFTSDEKLDGMKFIKTAEHLLKKQFRPNKVSVKYSGIN